MTEPVPSTPPAPSAPAGPDPEVLARGLDVLRGRQRLTLGLIAGAVVGLACVIAWGVVTALTDMVFGYAAIGVGIAVGWSVRKAGRGITPLFRGVAATLAVAATFLGNLLAVVIVIAEQQQIGIIEAIGHLAPHFGEMAKHFFDLGSLFFYAIAGWIGWGSGAQNPELAEVLAAAALPDAAPPALLDEPVRGGGDDGNRLPDR